MKSIAYTIPAEFPYMDARQVEIPFLTSGEIIALSYAYLDAQFEIRLYEDMAGKDGVISGWQDVTSSHESEQIGRLREAMHSLDRLGLVEGRYEHGPSSKERILSTDDQGHMRVAETGWRYTLTENGRMVQEAHRARIYRCCDAAVRLDCVCTERTFCPVEGHRSGCHGGYE